MPIGTETRRRRFHITGQVQGVGFRPFVYRLAKEGAFSGWVINDGCGVTIEVQGTPQQLDGFARRLRDELPPLAQIARFVAEEVPAERDPTRSRFARAKAAKSPTRRSPSIRPSAATACGR